MRICIDFVSAATLAALCCVSQVHAQETLDNSKAEFDWSGPYIGTLFSGYTGRYGANELFSVFPGDGRGDWNGAGITAVAGYNVQSNDMVFGGEASVSAASIVGSEFCGNVDYQCRGDLSSIMTLRARLGYLVDPHTLVFGTIGMTKGVATFGTDDGVRISETRNVQGTTIGLGTEIALSPNLIGRAALHSYLFDAEDFSTDVVYENISSRVTEIEIGLLYKF